MPSENELRLGRRVIELERERDALAVSLSPGIPCLNPSKDRYSHYYTLTQADWVFNRQI